MEFFVHGRLRLAAMSFVLAVLSACGSGGGGGDNLGGGSPSPSIGASAYFPSPTGAIWIYTTNASAQPDVVRVTGT